MQCHFKLIIDPQEHFFFFLQTHKFLIQNRMCVCARKAMATAFIFFVHFFSFSTSDFDDVSLSYVFISFYSVVPKPNTLQPLLILKTRYTAAAVDFTIAYSPGFRAHMSASEEVEYFALYLCLFFNFIKSFCHKANERAFLLMCRHQFLFDECVWGNRSGLIYLFYVFHMLYLTTHSKHTNALH